MTITVGDSIIVTVNIPSFILRTDGTWSMDEADSVLTGRWSLDTDLHANRFRLKLTCDQKEDLNLNTMYDGWVQKWGIVLHGPRPPQSMGYALRWKMVRK